MGCRCALYSDKRLEAEIEQQLTRASVSVPITVVVIVGVAQYVTTVQKLTETHTAEAAQSGERSAFHLDCAAALAFAVFDHLRGLAVKARRGPCDGSDKRYGVLS